MPRRFFKRLSRKRHTLNNRWFMRPFRAMLSDPAYWSLHRTNITRAVAIGLFISFIPLPIHTVTITLLALWLRLNVPVAVATVYVSNPLTLVPQFYFAYWVGSHLLGRQLQEFSFQMSWHWVQTGLLPIWQPFLFGCLILGITTSLLGYIVLGSLWHITLVMKYHERKRNSKAKKSANS